MSNPPVPFSVPAMGPQEIAQGIAAINEGFLQGDGRWTRQCQDFLEDYAGAQKVLLTTSGTAALELSTLLAGLGPGDEVIIPSFTFPSSANAVALRGATPVFVDSEAATMNLDAALVEAAITSRTRAIMPVHYAGVACDMQALRDIASRWGLMIIEDAAQAIGSTYRDTPVGSIGSTAAISFHVSKNLTCGEGGALIINEPALVERAEILWEKGTDRSRFLRGEVDRYCWRDVGSSFLPSDVLAAILHAQLIRLDEITSRRRQIWERYQVGLQNLEAAGRITRPDIPADRSHNGHIYFIMLRSADDRDNTRTALLREGIAAQSHYVPLHSSPAGRQLGRTSGTMATVDRCAERLLRLPLFATMSDGEVDRVISSLHDILDSGS